MLGMVALIQVHAKEKSQENGSATGLESEWPKWESKSRAPIRTYLSGSRKRAGLALLVSDKILSTSSLPLIYSPDDKAMRGELNSLLCCVCTSAAVHAWGDHCGRDDHSLRAGLQVAQVPSAQTASATVLTFQSLSPIQLFYSVLLVPKPHMAVSHSSHLADNPHYWFIDIVDTLFYMILLLVTTIDWISVDMPAPTHIHIKPHVVWRSRENLSERKRRTKQVHRDVKVRHGENPAGLAFPGSDSLLRSNSFFAPSSMKHHCSFTWNSIFCFSLSLSLAWFGFSWLIQKIWILYGPLGLFKLSFR